MASTFSFGSQGGVGLTEGSLSPLLGPHLQFLHGDADYEHVLVLQPRLPVGNDDVLGGGAGRIHARRTPCQAALCPLQSPSAQTCQDGMPAIWLNSPNP